MLCGGWRAGELRLSQDYLPAVGATVCVLGLTPPGPPPWMPTLDSGLSLPAEILQTQPGFMSTLSSLGIMLSPQSEPFSFLTYVPSAHDS